MFPYLDEFLALGMIGILGSISPGPDFIIVTQNTLRFGKNAGILTAVGITLGCAVHLSYCVIGIALLIAKSPFLFGALKWMGALYLIYLGSKNLFGKNKDKPPSFSKRSFMPSHELHYTPWQAIQKGFLINLLNPSSTVFFLSIFSQIIDPNTPRLIQAIYGFEFCFIAFLWFSLLSYLLNFPPLKSKLVAIQPSVEKLLGCAFILMGIQIATVVQKL